MAHANSRLSLYGRRLLVERVIGQGRPVAHVAKELGVSRQCAHRWVARFRAQGDAGLAERSSRPHRCPRRTAPDLEQVVLELRRRERRGQDWIGPELGLPARTVSAILRRHQVPYLRECDPLTGEVIRASKTTAVRYEHDHPGSLVHMDVKKVGRIAEGGGGELVSNHRSRPDKQTRVGYDYVHSMIDDHSRLAYSEILLNEKGATCAAFLLRAAGYFADQGITRIERVMTDNHFSYRRSNDVAAAIATVAARHVFIPHCPWQNGKVERYNRTLQIASAFSSLSTL
ncbi:IS481-like element IS1649 family transposase [soil metagenome]